MIALMLCGIICFSSIAGVGFPNGTYQISEKGQENAEVMRDTAMFYYYFNHKKMKEAGELLVKILDRRAETSFLVYTCALMYENGEFPEETFIALARRHPEAPLLCHLFAIALDGKGKKKIAYEILENAIAYRLVPPAENEEPREKKEKKLHPDFEILIREYLAFLDQDKDYQKGAEFLKKFFSIYSHENLKEETLIYFAVFAVHGQEKAHKEFYRQEIKRCTSILKKRMAGPNNYSFIMPGSFLADFQQMGESELLDALLVEPLLTRPLSEGAYNSLAMFYSQNESLQQCRIRALSLAIASYYVRTKKFPKRQLVSILMAALDADDEKTISVYLGRVMRMELMNDDLYYKLSVFYLEKNDIQKARSYCSEIKDPESRDLLMAVILEKQKKYREAMELFMKLERENTQSPYLKMSIAELARKIGDKETETQFRGEMLHKIDQSPDFQNYIAYTWIEQGINLDQAEKYLEKALKSVPDNYAYLDSMAWLYFKKKDYRKAKKFILEALEISEEGVLLDHAGDIFAALGEREKALAYWQRAAWSNDPELDIKAVLKKLPRPYAHKVKPAQNPKSKANDQKNAPAAPQKKVL